MNTAERKQLIAKVIEGIIDFKVIPFIGAGLSKGFGLKDWGELIADLKAEAATSETNFLKVAQAFENKFGRGQLLDKLKQYYTVDDVSKFDMSLHELLLAMAPPIIYTTNYDNVIEDVAILSHRNYYKIACLKDMVSCPHAAAVLVKFHGDFSAPEEIVLTENDYSRRMAIEHPLDIRLRADIIGKGLLFIGYSLDDDNMNFILEKHVKQYGKDNLPLHYLITFDSRITPQRISDLESENVKVIQVGSPGELYALIKTINEEVYHGTFKKQLADLSKSKPGKVLLRNELENLISYFRNGSYSDEEKARKISETIAWKTIPEYASTDLLNFYKEVIYSDGLIKSKEAMLVAFTHLSMKTTVYFQIAVELMELTKFEELNWGMTPSISFTDVLSDIEITLGRELALLATFLFLTKCYEERRVLSFEQADRIFYALAHYRYQEMDKIYDELIPAETRGQLIEHFLNQHPEVLRNRFKFPLISGRPTGSETVDFLLKTTNTDEL